MKKVAAFALLITFCSVTLADSPALQTSFKDKLKQIKAKMKYQNEDYKAALRLYRDIYVNEAENALINYRIGQCHLALRSINEALEYFEKAFKLNNYLNGIHLSLGQAYHLKGDLDKAVEEYNKYKETLSASKLEKDDVVFFLGQCEYAKTLMDK
ncbi:MAG: tetratricopeptide repeat protein, partial [Flavobacteriales bacterium]|nr:tetratricopeptide repeat protein [Flavobacteriales bacterium]